MMNPNTRELVKGEFVELADGSYYRISHVERMPVFLMNLVSSSDLWMFIASNGGLTAGRVNPEQALFPYVTVDKVYDAAGVSGSMTALWCGEGADAVLWEPMAPHTPRVHKVTRFLYKSVEGDRVVFEELNEKLGLLYRLSWASSEQHGYIRSVELENIGKTACRLRVLDGVKNVLPPGIGRRLQTGSSSLADAYKTVELVGDAGLAVYGLASQIVDQAVAMESLRASVVWSAGVCADVILLGERQVEDFMRGAGIKTERSQRGVRGAYLVEPKFTLAPGERRPWMMGMDTGLSQSDVIALKNSLSGGKIHEEVKAGVRGATARLRALVGAADGLQKSGDDMMDAHHFANVMFNVMRGGIFAEGMFVRSADFYEFSRTRNRALADQQRTFFDNLPEKIHAEDLLARARASGVADLERLSLEYLPLTFSRRHGDPSRPWNQFSIVVRDEKGPVLNYEGNWRDIFQNWEALGLSFPGYMEHFIAKFLNASTRDGYNPFRVTRRSIEWEVPDPEDPWAGIGYWGDHQAVYLLRLLEWSRRFHPGILGDFLGRDIFSFANVPYRIAGYREIIGNPRETITFDKERHREILRMEESFGTDARLVLDENGKVCHVNLAEKLLVLMLTKLSNFIPGAGIWMNTQRPEWNDANNALVGYGVSMVTLCYLRRLLAFWREQLLPMAQGDLPVGKGVWGFLRSVDEAFARHEGILSSDKIDAGDRRLLVDALGTAGTEYRESCYAGIEFGRESVSVALLSQAAERALAFIDHSLRLGRRDDGLWHSYNLLSFEENPARLELEYLPLMLEGQVAILSSGFLGEGETVELLRSLRNSALYREDQRSYLLYPDKVQGCFLDRGVIDSETLHGAPLLGALLASGNNRIIVKDRAGSCRFAPGMINAEALGKALDALAENQSWKEKVECGRREVLAAYERVFNHHAFTGRSGSMFCYEGLGCIYWHMISKLLLAVGEHLDEAIRKDSQYVGALRDCYTEVQSGIGFRKTAEIYGAFPADPYSHTPGHAGAQQPGMTGQVKEEIIARLPEMGMRVEDGCLSLGTRLLPEEVFLKSPGEFIYMDVDGREQRQTLDADSLGFTLCGVPVIYRKGGGVVKVVLADGSEKEFPDGHLDRESSHSIFRREGRIAGIFLG